MRQSDRDRAGTRHQGDPVGNQAEREHDIVGDTKPVENDVPAIGSHHHAGEQRRERERDQQALPPAARADQEIGQRVGDQNIEHADGNSDGEGPHDRFQIEAARQHERVIVQRHLVGEELGIGLEEADGQQQPVRQREECDEKQRRHAGEQPAPTFAGHARASP